jgi:hypothetical protein
MTADIAKRFDSEYMRKRLHIAWRGSIIAQAIYDALKPTSVVDVGCSVGDILKGLADLGVETVGIEGSTACISHFLSDESHLLIRDLRQPWDWTDAFASKITRQRFDLCLCFEVLSILDQKYHEVAIQNLTQLSDHILCNHIPAIPGYRENLTIPHLIQEHLHHWQHKQAMKAIYRTVRYFIKEKNEKGTKR